MKNQEVTHSVPYAEYVLRIPFQVGALEGFNGGKFKYDVYSDTMHAWAYERGRAFGAALRLHGVDFPPLIRSGATKKRAAAVWAKRVAQMANAASII